MGRRLSLISIILLFSCSPTVPTEQKANTKNMTCLEDLQPTATVRGFLPEQVVTVVSVEWFGSEALELTYKGPSGRVANELLYRHDEPRKRVSLAWVVRDAAEKYNADRTLAAGE